jgi:YD repeat-containing protein
MNFNGGRSTGDQLVEYDSLGRPQITAKRQAPGASAFDITAVNYDALGRQYQSSLPYSGSPTTASTTPGTAMLYDALGRPSSVTDSGGGVTAFAWTQNDLLVTQGPAAPGENPKQRQLEYNGAGQLTSVCEISSAAGSGACGQNKAQNGFLTKYTYDGAGRLTGVNQNAQASSCGVQTRSVQYDVLGRTLSQTIPEWSAGTGVPGTTSYVCDSDPSGSCSGSFPGDLVKKTDNMGNVSCMAYDSLHRLVSSSVVAGPYSSVTPQSYYVYDSATLNGTAMQNVKGSIAEAYTCPSTGCGTKLTDTFISASPETSGSVKTGRITAQVWDSQTISILQATYLITYR